MLIESYKKGCGMPQSEIEELIMFSVIPLITEYGQYVAQALFVECLSAYNMEIGTIHVLFEKKYPISIGFILDEQNSIHGAPHLHVFSTYISKQKLGYGKILLSEILKVTKKLGLTLECSDSSSEFFKKNGLHKRPKKLLKNYVSMFTSNAENKEFFQKVSLTKSVEEKYTNIYQECIIRMNSKGLISFTDA